MAMTLTLLAGGVMDGTDAWSREARRVREPATRLRLSLDEEELALQDVHDLQTLHLHLHRRLHTGRTRAGWAVLQKRAIQVRSEQPLAVRRLLTP